MEFNFLAILFLGISIFCLILTIYLKVQLKGKRKDSASLDDRLKELKIDVSEAEKRSEILTSDYEDKKNSLKYLFDLKKQCRDPLFLRLTARMK